MEVVAPSGMFSGTIAGDFFGEGATACTGVSNLIPKTGVSADLEGGLTEDLVDGDVLAGDEGGMTDEIAGEEAGAKSSRVSVATTSGCKIGAAGGVTSSFASSAGAITGAAAGGVSLAPSSASSSTCSWLMGGEEGTGAVATGVVESKFG